MTSSVAGETATNISCITSIHGSGVCTIWTLFRSLAKPSKCAMLQRSLIEHSLVVAPVAGAGAGAAAAAAVVAAEEAAAAAAAAAVVVA
eukprot:CAMPEP_0202369664 /NCGR_PEP_ID=MMETSP1127-20130417/1447_1 /ASSEMBLY_ACC=CAM_ASM_000462 /TAXON_ID=3047 /ORGANISM="Dunaliella tertiolecta, Strain CCMP1320" /LENGTH=88 /DNA_ID=CAMNT_0048965385 /DNA_START=148 /DNA_END=412 /DNA_ORIENTATION=-